MKKGVVLDILKQLLTLFIGFLMKKQFWIIFAIATLSLNGHTEDSLITKAKLAFNDNFSKASSRYLELYMGRVGSGSKEEAEATVFLARSYALEERFADLVSLLAKYNGKTVKSREISLSTKHDLVFWAAYGEMKLSKFSNADASLKWLLKQKASPELKLDTLTALAESSFKQKKFTVATDYYMLITEKYSDLPQSRYARSETIKLFLADHQFFWAEREIDKMVAEDVKSGEKDGLGLKLFLLTLKGESKAAISLYNTLIVDVPDRRDSSWFLVTFYLAALLEQKQNYELSSELYAKALIFSTSTVSSEKVMYKLAGSYVKGGEFLDATAILEEYLVAFPNSTYRVEVKMSLAGLCQKVKKFDRAILLLKSVIEDQQSKDNDRFESQLQLAAAYTSRGESDLAIKAYLGASAFANKAEDKAKSVYLAAEQSYKQKDYEQAATYYQVVTVKYASSPYAEKSRFYQGLSFLNSKSYLKATKSFTEFEVEFPSSTLLASAIYQSGVALREAGKISEAKNQFFKVFKGFKVSSEAPQSAVNYADSMVELGHALQIIDTLKEAVVTFQERAMIGALYERLIYIQLTFGEPNEAIDTANSFVANYSKDPLVDKILFRIANYWYNQGHWINARKTYLRITHDFKDNALAQSAYLQVGLVSVKFDTALAMPVFEKIMQSPDFSPNIKAQVSLAMGNLKISELKYREAILDFAFCMENSMDLETICVALGRQSDAYFLLGELKQAIVGFRKLTLKAEPFLDLKEQASFKLGESLLSQGEAPEAVEILQQLIYNYTADISNNVMRDWKYFSRTVFVLSDYYVGEKKYKEAITVLERLEKLNLPVSPEASKRANVLRKKYGENK